jgi:16S rRNA processing protein RimM
VKVESYTDFPQRFDHGSVLWLAGRPVKVEGSRVQGKALLLKLEGVDDRSAADLLRGQDMLAPPYEDLAEGTYYRDDLIGMAVVDAGGTTLGELSEIFATGSNDVYVVRGPRGELLLPATDDVVREIDAGGRRILVEVSEGLEWVRATRPAGRPQRSRRASTTATS